MKKKIIAFVFIASLAALMVASGSGVPGQDGTPPASQPARADTTWTTPVDISNTSAMSRAPVAAFDGKGNLYVTWVDWPYFYGAGGPRNIMFNTNRTGQWQAGSTVISPVFYYAIDDTGFPTVAVTPSGSNIFVAYHDGDFVAQLMQVYYREWSNGAWGSVDNFSRTPAPSEYITLGISPIDNTLFGIYMVDVDVPFEFAMKYRDGQTGEVKGPEMLNVLNRNSKYLYLTKVFAFDPKGTAHLAFSTHTQAWYSKNVTPKNFNSWTDAVNLSAYTGLSDTDPRIAVDNDGEAYVVWQHVVGGNQEIMLRKTVNGGWQAAENISQTTTDSEFPTIAVNPATKEIYVAWQEIVSAGNAEVFLKSYELQPGTTTYKWSDNVNFSNNSGPSGEPWIVCEPNGNLHLFYVDSPAGNPYEIMYSFKLKQRIIPKPNPPLNPAIDTRLDGTGTKKIHKITWQANPANADIPLKNYKLYRKLSGSADSSYVLLATVSPTTLQYEDTGLDLDKNHTYRLTALSENDDESDPSTAVTSTKKFEFPPLNPAIRTTIRRTRILFHLKQEKINTFTFSGNPLNPDGEVSGYEIYRKRVEDGDDQFAVFATLDKSTFSYQYIISPPDSITQKYAYAVKALFSDGRKSAFSAIAIEN